MLTFTSLDDWKAYRQCLSHDARLGFVPTMGNLHKGHVALMKQAVLENDIAIASIFVNPTQFNNPDDFLHYPKTLEQDLECLEQAGVSACLLPNEASLYADGFRFQIQETHQSLLLEGQHRPGHFTGVLTIVMKLLQLVRPSTAYFGEKDYQQYQLIKGMVEGFFLPIHIKACPTIREDSGLAYSSRNHRLNAEQKEQAIAFAKAFHQAHQPTRQIQKAIEALGIKIDYVEEHQGRRFAAVYIDDIRLIDNYALTNSR